MKTITKTKTFNAPKEVVFQNLDDLGVTGSHMTHSSIMMMGSKLKLTWLTQRHNGLGSKYRWTGEMMGLTMDFTVIVTKWIESREKIWETIGECKLILYSWYRMSLNIEPGNDGTTAHLSITFRRPKPFLFKLLSFCFADLYCIWCLNKMLGAVEMRMTEKQLHVSNT
jgi:hypothetical protein